MICDKVVFYGDLRTVSKEVERYVKLRIDEICRGTAEANRAESEVDFFKDFPAMVYMPLPELWGKRTP